MADLRVCCMPVSDRMQFWFQYATPRCTRGQPAHWKSLCLATWLKGIGQDNPPRKRCRDTSGRPPRCQLEGSQYTHPPAAVAPSMPPSPCRNLLDSDTAWPRSPMAQHSAIACRRGPPTAGYRLIEQCQVDCVAHLAIPKIARVKPVAAIVDWQHLGQTLGVTQRLVEIDDAVQGAAFADPIVDRDAMPLAHRVPGTGQERLISEWR